jgi:lysophospholipase L1-like esterase
MTWRALRSGPPRIPVRRAPSPALRKKALAIVTAVALLPMTLGASAPPATFGTYGDSHTAFVRKTLQEGRAANGSWTNFASSNAVSYAGYWAKSGATTEDMLKQVRCHHDDFLALMIGTNDITRGWSTARSQAAIVSIAKRSCAEDVVLLALPPRAGKHAPSHLGFNKSLAALASSRGWLYFDAWTALRAKNGTWLHGSYSPDGLHASRAIYEAAGRAIGKFLLKRARGSGSGRDPGRPIAILRTTVANRRAAAATAPNGRLRTAP